MGKEWIRTCTGMGKRSSVAINMEYIVNNGKQSSLSNKETNDTLNVVGTLLNVWIKCMDQFPFLLLCFFS
jgi:hypothetical protein